MPVLSGVYLESWLISFIRNTVSYSGAKHHLGALHEIEHHVFKSWYERLLVDQIEVHLVISRNLDPYIAADEIDLATHLLELVILGPVAGFLVNLEKQDGAGRSCDQCLVEEEVHRPKVSTCNFLYFALRWILSIDSGTMALSVEGIAVSGNGTIKALDRKV
jgi:hypothetical protein